MRLAFFITLCVCLVYYSGAMPYTPPLETLGGGEYCIYSSEFINSPLVTKRINTGFSYIYYCAPSDAAALRKAFSKIDGESVVISGVTPSTAAKILSRLKYRIVSVTASDECKIYYAYSPRAKTYITDGGRRINLQVCYRDGSLAVGWPVILGSY